MKMGDPNTDSVLIILTVPTEWKRLPVPEIAAKLLENEPGLSVFLAAEVKRWAPTGAVNLTTLQEFIDQRTKGTDG